MLFLLLALFFAPYVASAHGSEASIERMVGEYLVDVGYDPDPLVAQSQASFDFSLVYADGSGPVVFDRVWVRIAKDRDVYFAGGIGRADLGGTTLLTQFPTHGTYTLLVRFENDGESVAEVEESLAVAPSGRNYFSKWYVLVVGIICAGTLGFIGGSIVAKK